MTQHVFLGSYTRRESQGIYRLENDQTTLVAQLENPTYIVERDHVLYSIFGGENGCGIAIYDIVGKELKEIQKVYSDEEGGPCHICVDENHEVVVTANYGEHCFHVYRKLNGQFQEPTRVEIVQEGSHIHYVYYSNKTNILYVTDLGTDKVYLYHLDDLDQPFETLLFPDGSGIRHLEFDKDDSLMFVNAEYSGEIFVYENLKQIGVVKTNPEHDFDEAMAAIRLSDDKEFLAVSGRSANEIIIYKVDDGYLSEHQRFSTKGDHPRDFNYLDDETILVANMKSDNCVFFTCNSKSKEFTYSHEIQQPEVSCVCVVK